MGVFLDFGIFSLERTWDGDGDNLIQNGGE